MKIPSKAATESVGYNQEAQATEMVNTFPASPEKMKPLQPGAITERYPKDDPGVIGET